MKDNSDIPLPSDELRSRVLVFAITDEITHEYEEITKGYVELITDEDEKNITFHYLQVKDEKTSEVLMRSNLRVQNNFGKQKGSIISWTDQQQPQYTELALSFQKDRQCDIFWRTICEKVGKSYLQINGAQKLEAPNQDNLNNLLQKAKNSIDLVDYNIVHSKPMMQGLKQVFYEMQKNKDQMGMGTVLRIVNAMLSPVYSSNAIQTLLTGQNFYLILDLQHFKKNINFRQIYEQKVGRYLKNKFKFPQQVFQKIEVSHRAVFYRENVIDLSEQVQLQSMMFMISRQALIQIMSYLNRSKFFENLVKLTQYPNTLCRQSNSLEQFESDKDPGQLSEQLNNDKIHFIHEALIMFQQIASEQIKITFKQNVYSSGILPFIKDCIQRNNLKATQILYYIAQLDKIKFFQFLIQDFKQNSNQNLLKTLMKKFIHQPEYRGPILLMIESFTLLFNQKKQFFDFFNGTFICSVFTVAKDPRCILFLSNVLLSHLQNTSVIFNQLIKSKICEKLASQYRSGSSLKSKLQELQMLKFLKHVIVQQSIKKTLKNKEIQKNIIESGYFDCCMMIYFKHSQKYNVLSSSMMQNLKLLQKMDYSDFDAYLIKQHASNQALGTILEPIRKKHIEFINKKASKNLLKEYIEIQRMAHEQILENQEQESYLMNDQNQNLGNPMKSENHEDQKHKSLSIETNDEVKKQNDLQYLKRMMDQFSQDREQQELSRLKQPRKALKKQENTNQIGMEFTFDLPDMDQLREGGLQDT